MRQARAPDREWLTNVRFNAGSWRHRAVLAALGQLHPRDLLTGERIEVEQHFATGAIHGHHLFPRRWAISHYGSAEHPAYMLVDSIGNIAAVTGYTNGWIGGRAPSHYLADIRDRIGQDRARELLEEHLADYDRLLADDFDAFFADRLERISAHLVGLVRERQTGLA